jgi:hypothetical protein
MFTAKFIKVSYYYYLTLIDFSYLNNFFYGKQLLEKTIIQFFYGNSKGFERTFLKIKFVPKFMRFLTKSIEILLMKNDWWAQEISWNSKANLKSRKFRGNLDENTKWTKFHTCISFSAKFFIKLSLLKIKSKKKISKFPFCYYEEFWGIFQILYFNIFEHSNCRCDSLLTPVLSSIRWFSWFKRHWIEKPYFFSTIQCDNLFSSDFWHKEMCVFYMYNKIL